MLDVGFMNSDAIIGTSMQRRQLPETSHIGSPVGMHASVITAGCANRTAAIGLVGVGETRNARLWIRTDSHHGAEITGRTDKPTAIAVRRSSWVIVMASPKQVSGLMNEGVIGAIMINHEKGTTLVHTNAIGLATQTLIS